MWSQHNTKKGASTAAKKPNKQTKNLNRWDPINPLIVLDSLLGKRTSVVLILSTAEHIPSYFPNCKQQNGAAHQ